MRFLYSHGTRIHYSHADHDFGLVISGTHTGAYGHQYKATLMLSLEGLYRSRQRLAYLRQAYRQLRYMLLQQINHGNHHQ